VHPKKDKKVGWWGWGDVVETILGLVTGFRLLYNFNHIPPLIVLDAHVTLVNLNTRNLLASPTLLISMSPPPLGYVVFSDKAILVIQSDDALFRHKGCLLRNALLLHYSYFTCFATFFDTLRNHVFFQFRQGTTFVL